MLAVIAIILPVFIFAAASYRPERNPEITQALNDLGWLPFIMNWVPAVIQALAIGFAIFGNAGAKEVFPRWVGYYNLWSGFIFCAGALRCCSRPACSRGMACSHSGRRSVFRRVVHEWLGNCSRLRRM